MTYAAGQATMLQPLSIPTHGLQAIRGRLKRHGVLMERLLRPNSNLDLAAIDAKYKLEMGNPNNYKVRMVGDWTPNEQIVSGCQER